MFQLNVSTTDGIVHLKELAVEKETKMCFFFESSSTEGHIYRFEKSRLEKLQVNGYNVYVIFEDIEFLGEAKLILTEYLGKKINTLENNLDTLQVANTGVREIDDTFVREYKSMTR